MKIPKNVFLFILVCAFSGIFIFIGSVLGSAAGKIGLFIGALVGGFVGIGAATALSNRIGFLEGAAWLTVFLYAMASFALAAIIAVTNLSGPVIPIASVSLIGIGALLGKFVSNHRKRR